jgi:hypothetical protein
MEKHQGKLERAVEETRMQDGDGRIIETRRRMDEGGD